MEKQYFISVLTRQLTVCMWDIYGTVSDETSADGRKQAIALIGGGTAMIGDPSGRTDMRQMMTPETIQHNVDCFKSR